MFDLDKDPMDTETCVYVGCGGKVSKGHCVCDECIKDFDEYVRLDRLEMENGRRLAAKEGSQS